MPAEGVLRALRHVWITLEPLNRPMAVLGGIALASWKHVRATRDVDLLLNIGKNDPHRVLGLLRAAGIRIKHDPPITSFGKLDLVELLYEPPEAFVELQIDLLLAASAYHEQALKRRIATRLPDLDVEIAVLSCEDMILHKLLAGRIIDRADAAALLRANRESLDCDYLLYWTKALELRAAWTEVWIEAFPEQPPPDVP